MEAIKIKEDMTVNQHYTLHQLNNGLFIKEVKKSKNKSTYYISGSGVDMFLSELTFIKLYGLCMLKGDNNKANINQHWILSDKGKRYIQANPFLD